MELNAFLRPHQLRQLALQHGQLLVNLYPLLLR